MAKNQPVSQDTAGGAKNEPTEVSREREIREAVERVYRAYGSDLSAFRRDVQRDLVKLSTARARQFA